MHRPHERIGWSGEAAEVRTVGDVVAGVPADDLLARRVPLGMGHRWATGHEQEQGRALHGTAQAKVGQPFAQRQTISWALMLSPNWFNNRPTVERPASIGSWVRRTRTLSEMQ